MTAFQFQARCIQTALAVYWCTVSRRVAGLWLWWGGGGVVAVVGWRWCGCGGVAVAVVL